MQNVSLESGPKKDLTIHRGKIFTKLKKGESMNSLGSSTDSSPKNKTNNLYPFDNEEAFSKFTCIEFNSLEFERNFEKKGRRTDNFGKVIKKGGKHKIAFADELPFTLPKYKIKRSQSDRNNINNKRRNSMPMFIRYKSEILKSIKRNNSFDISKKYIDNHFYNKFSLNNSKTKPTKFISVDIINVESTKKENKLNTYFISEDNIFKDVGDVSCSCYCSIF